MSFVVPPRPGPTSLVNVAAWRAAEAELAVDLADLAFDAGRLAERLRAAGAGALQRLALEELIDGYTRDAAYAEFQEQQKGMVRVGMLADLVLLNADLFATPEDAIAQVKPLLTMVDGRAVFREI